MCKCVSLTQSVHYRDCYALADIAQQDIEAFLAECMQRGNANGPGRTVKDPKRYAHGYSMTLHRFFRWATNNGRLLASPMDEIKVRRPATNPPREIFTIDEMKRLLDAPDTATPVGLRDRAILELLYSTGIRRSELVALDLNDVDLSQLRLFVCDAKGGKDRVIPIGKSAGRWLSDYLNEGRFLLERDSSDIAFFLNAWGGRCVPNRITKIVVQYREQAGIETKGAVHSVRHSFATHLMENGADIRYVQELLGHSKIETTSIYTRVVPTSLDESHKNHHPRGIATKEKRT